MTCSGLYQAPIVRSPTPGETHGQRTMAWTPCQLPSHHPGPCGPRPETPYLDPALRHLERHR